MGSPGIARICLTEKDIRLSAKDEIVIPATTVFEDDGPNVGQPEDPSTWRYEVKEGFKFPAQFLTLSSVSLRKEQPMRGSKGPNADRCWRHRNNETGLGEAYFRH